MDLLSRLYARKKLKVPPFPPRLQIETTNRCNAACAMCPILEMDRPKGTMSLELFAKISRELAQVPPLRRIILHIMGEPLLNPDFIDMVRLLRREAPHQPVEFSTNAALLGPDQAEALIEAGVEAINFSLDACTPETHAKIRKGLNYDKVVSNLENFVAALAASGRSKPEIRIQLIRMDANQNEWDDFAARWKEADKHDFVKLYIKELWSWGGKLESGLAAKEKAGGGLTLPCDFPFDQLDVYWDGRVGFCCLDQNADLTVGDVNRNSLAQIWRSDRLALMRRRFLRADFTGLRCAGCGERFRRIPFKDIGLTYRARLKKVFPA